jgi:hypothetical protein
MKAKPVLGAPFVGVCKAVSTVRCNCYHHVLTVATLIDLYNFTVQVNWMLSSTVTVSARLCTLYADALTPWKHHRKFQLNKGI